ncbi:MAG: DUF2213 domain-containing protein [Planctomycetota bacterium]|jgi:hypothetical protein
MESVNRFDFVPLGKSIRTPAGYLKFDANLTRVGVLKYRNADGSVRRELRHPDEVFKNDSLATLGGATVTNLHPSEMLSPHNYKQYTVGDVSERIKHDDRFVTGSITIKEDSMIQAIGKGDRKELSPGYRCTLDNTPGEYNGEKYDAIQRNIIYNHVGIGPPGWGRSGSDVALRLDGDDAASYSPAVNKPPDGDKQREKPKMKIHIDGIEYEAGSQSAVDAWNKHHAAIVAERDALQTKLDQAEGRATAADNKVKEVTTKLDEATNLERLDALVEQKVELVAKGREIIGKDADLVGKTPRQIKEAILTKLDEKAKFDGMSDDHVDGAYTYAIANHTPDTQHNQTQHLDGNALLRMLSSAGSNLQLQDKPIDHYDDAAARDRMEAESENAWKESN